MQVDLAQAPVALPECLARGLLVAIVLAQVEDFREDLLALLGGLGGEFVGPALQDEGRVDEGLLVHPQQGVDRLLGLAEAGAG